MWENIQEIYEDKEFYSLSMNRISSKINNKLIRNLSFLLILTYNKFYYINTIHYELKLLKILWMVFELRKLQK